MTRFLALVLLASAVGACSSPMSRAKHAFDEGRYPDAAGELRRLEPEVPEWSERAKARYALTRGLTHLACGDARLALHWLTDAKRRWEADPSLFDASERGRLIAAWRSMGLMPAESGAAKVGLAR